MKDVLIGMALGLALLAAAGPACLLAMKLVL